jgi:tRNA uridine 5-carbamoylmethylation protein Kti12
MSKKDGGRSSETTITVLLLMGLPSSGKSSLARKLQEALEGNETKGDSVADDSNNESSFNTNRKVVCIEYDAIEESILLLLKTRAGTPGDGEDKDQANQQESEILQREAWNQARVVAVERLQKELDRAIAEAAASPSSNPSKHTTTILLDDNFHLRGMRKQIHRLLLKYKDVVTLKFGILWVTCPLETCLERNRQRPRQVPHHVIVTMHHETLEPPTRAAWEASNTLEINDGTTSFQDVLEFVQNCPAIVDLPPEPDEEQQAADRATTLTNQVHNWDNILRTWVGQTISKVDRCYAKAANAARTELLRQIKQAKAEGGSTQDAEKMKEAFAKLVLPDSESEELRSKISEALTVPC